MPFILRPYRHFPVQCPVTYNAGPFQGQGTVWNLSIAGWRLSGDFPMRPGETVSLSVTLPNQQCIHVSEGIVRWVRDSEIAVENVFMDQHTKTRLQHYVTKLAREGYVENRMAS